MTELRLTTEKEATSIDDIKPRQDDRELTRALIALANELVVQARREKKDLKYKLDKLPPGTRPKAVQTKIYALKEAGKLPEKIFPSLRTFKERDESGNVIKTEEVIYMRFGAPGKSTKKGA